MKPDWKDAPVWAQYLAMDHDGVWWWYEHKPIKLFGNEGWHVRQGRSLQASRFTHWGRSLEQRPE